MNYLPNYCEGCALNPLTTVRGSVPVAR